jgi:hypothetical protein
MAVHTKAAVIAGVKSISLALYGDDQRGPRRVERLISEVPKPERLPVFRLGRCVCITPEALARWIEEREGVAQAE